MCHDSLWLILCHSETPVRGCWDGFYVGGEGKRFGHSVFPESYDSRSLLSIGPHPPSLLTIVTPGTRYSAKMSSKDGETRGISNTVKNDTDGPEPWKPVQYFFYGSLMDERKLTEVLRLTHPPVLRPASIVGYSIKMWGPYPTLVDGPPGNVVNGMTYEVQNEANEGRLAYYETKAYKCTTCLLSLRREETRLLGRRLCGQTIPTMTFSNQVASISMRGKRQCMVPNSTSIVAFVFARS